MLLLSVEIISHQVRYIIIISIMPHYVHKSEFLNNPPVAVLSQTHIPLHPWCSPLLRTYAFSTFAHLLLLPARSAVTHAVCLLCVFGNLSPLLPANKPSIYYILSVALLPAAQVCFAHECRKLVRRRAAPAIEFDVPISRRFARRCSTTCHYHTPWSPPL